MTNTITRAGLAEAVQRAAPVSGTEAAGLVDEIIEQITRALELGEDVKLTSFATFALKDKVSRIGRNPRTGEEKIISARRVVSFTASSALKSRVNSRSVSGS
ncbi:integration host factor subunit alpha [Agrobacterium rubi]|nr:integration host factor subunit alpha [Agrobacterium rubi]NTF24022.1 integration host factor subunit alpha [Agrobacterium rubi]